MELDFDYDSDMEEWVVSTKKEPFIASQGKTIVIALLAFADAYELYCEEHQEP